MPVFRLLIRILSYGLLSVGLFIMLTNQGWETLQKHKEKKKEQVQDQRKQLLKEICDNNKETFYKDFNKDKRHFHRLIVDDTHALIYCYVPKAACSTLKRVMLTLKQGEPYCDPMDIEGNVHNKVPYLTMFPKHRMMAKLKHYTKFLFVRDPFVRLISAYRDKIQNHNEPFYSLYARNILRRYGKHPDPPKTLKQAVAAGVQATFRNFIQYLVDPQTERRAPFEPHWRQMYRLCHPCHIDYDFIGHQETLEDDMKHLLKMLQLQDDINIPRSYDNMTSQESVVSWFSSVPLNERNKLYKLYENDFKLFGYRKPDELFQTT